MSVKNEAGVKKKYIVNLSGEEREYLQGLIRSGKTAARKQRNARILLKADVEGGQKGLKDEEIAKAVEVGRVTVERTRQRFVEEGFEVALNGRKSNRVYRRKLDGDGEAHLIAAACSEAPEGRSRWTLKLLADRLVSLEVVDSISGETVRRTLKKRIKAMAIGAMVHPPRGQW